MMMGIERELRNHFCDYLNRRLNNAIIIQHDKVRKVEIGYGTIILFRKTDGET